MERRKLYLKVFLNTIIDILILLAAIFILPKFLKFFLPFIIGWIIAMIANPLVRFLEKKVKIVRRHSSAIIIIGVLAGMVAIVYFCISLAIKEITQFSTDLPDLYQKIEEGTQLFTNKLSGFISVLPGDSKNVFDKLSDNLLKAVTEFLSDIDIPTISQAGDMARNIIDGLFMVIVTLLSAYFFIADRDRLIFVLRKNLPKVILEKTDMIKDSFKRAFGGYFRAQFKIMFVVWLILFVGFVFLQIDYAFLLAFIVAFIDLLPFFGTGLVIGPWAIYELVVGNMGTVVFLVVIYLVCQVVKQILQPKMVGDSIGISPLATLFFMFVGYRFGDFLGLIIGIPIGMVLVNLYHAGVFDSLLEGYRIIIKDLSDFLKG